jgi:hypothetical protein
VRTRVCRCLAWAVCALLAVGNGTASAQLRRNDPKDTPGPYVIDARGVLLGVPAVGAFYPSAPSGTRVPKRSLGFDVGAHVYRGTLGPAHLGFGVDLVKSRGTVSTTPVVAPVGATSGTSSSSSGTGTAGPVDVVTHFTGIAPQISFNFGGRNGWSYLGGGVGMGTFSSAITQDRSGPAAGRVTLTNDGQWARSVNIGAGARWFTSDRLAFTFDARIHKLGASGTRPATQMFGMSVGLSLR